MTLVVTTNATILCKHNGRVMLDAKQQVVTSDGSLILREGDLVGQPIMGCEKSKGKCTTVASTTGGVSRTLQVVGRAAHLETLKGATDKGATIYVMDPGQTTIHA